MHKAETLGCDQFDAQKSSVCFMGLRDHKQPMSVGRSLLRYYRPIVPKDEKASLTGPSPPSHRPSRMPLSGEGEQERDEK
jgi:hypothetical protein